MQILYSVKKFWEDLKWADSDREMEDKEQISHDILRFTILYYDKLSEKVQNLEGMNILANGIFSIPLEIFIAIANFNKVSQESEACVTQLTKSLENSQNILGNSKIQGEKAIHQILNFTLMKTTATVRKLMIESADKTNDNADRVISYIEDTLTLIHEYLENKDIKSAKSVLWGHILMELENLIQASIQSQRMPQFFSNLKKILSILTQIFVLAGDDDKEHNEEENDERLKKIEHILDCYGLNTSRLIHQYFVDRYEMQLQVDKTPFNPYGMLTIICFFRGNTLNLEILNARNLVPIGPNKKCDSFVKISIAPRMHFFNFKNIKTKVHPNTHFPLYEESFVLELSEDQKNIADAIVCFTIKDKYRLGSDECIAEAFLSFRDISETASKEKSQQKHLTLTRLQSDGECIKLILLSFFVKILS